MLSLPKAGEWQPTGESVSPLHGVCQKTRQLCSLWHPDKQPITVIKAELGVLVLCASSAFMWTSKLEKQLVDGDHNTIQIQIQN